MHLDISHIGQIALPVRDVDKAEGFYEATLGLRKLFRFRDLVFFDCAGVRLMIEKHHDETPDEEPGAGAVIYFRCADISIAVRELQRRGVLFIDMPHLIAAMDDHDLWMAFFEDLDGHTLALMQEAPKGYTPPPIEE
jgi:methylmalonyl-CoA/ethylmalonyl-CoA epimerase